ncbi:hypothetical protein BBAD15_g2250 [Beauveria bassiana D1-5]|uniref:Uncharacterized protein n=1 Tax=Beauveria bassiana D1-5 TaxID=1245745 RepID=A0A0A2VVN7_BEABA|nr:hypothetical protein BBAD15_g2250 [Beauveria bassiana D1-5]
MSSSSIQNQFLVLSPEIRPAKVQPAAAAAAAPRFLSLAPDVADSPTLAAVDAAVPVSNTRVLKLSPVHWGAHVEDHQGDYHDLVRSA